MEKISRRTLCRLGTGLAITPLAAFAAQEPKPVEAAFERDYPAPEFKPGWKKPVLSRLQIQDFIIYAHSDLEMAKKLLDREPMLINAFMDWGAGDWESALGGASHMGRHDIVRFLLDRGARIDIFCAAMMGQIEAVKAFLTLEPKLIDARRPPGFKLPFPGQLAGEKTGRIGPYLTAV